MSKLFIASMSLFFILIFGGLEILPEYRELQSMKVKIIEKEEELSMREEYLVQLESLSQKLKQYEAGFKKINSALPADPDLPSLFRFLEKISIENGLVLKSVGPFAKVEPARAKREEKNKERKKIEAKIEKTETEFKVSGTVDAFVNFLTSLEKSARLIEVSHISFKTPKEGDIFVFSVKVRVHSYQP